MRCFFPDTLHLLGSTLSQLKASNFVLHFCHTVHKAFLQRAVTYLVVVFRLESPTFPQTHNIVTSVVLFFWQLFSCFFPSRPQPAGTGIKTSSGSSRTARSDRDGSLILSGTSRSIVRDITVAVPYNGPGYKTITRAIESKLDGVPSCVRWGAV